ncbi:MAG: recombination mediator RecR [Phycisphaerales bacterium]|jgi:recombination protein RecR|nr:recombination mediator RecR [Phycisphaerales bacterium]
MSLRDSKGTPKPVKRLLDCLTVLPGIGKRSAERIAFYLIKDVNNEAMDLSRAISDVKQQVVCCEICNNIADESPCAICQDPQRDGTVVLVVEQPRDLIRLEATGMFNGVYHVLTGRIEPLAGVEASDLTIDKLLQRVDDCSKNVRGLEIKEVVLGLNPNLEGDSTSLYLASELNLRMVAVTRLARGLPSGSQIEFANTQVLSDAIASRQSMR